MLLEVLPELSTICMSLWTWRHCELYQRVIAMAVRQWRTRLCVSRRKVDTLNTLLASSVRPLLVGHSCLF